MTDTCSGSATMSAICAQTYWNVESRATVASAGAYRGNVGADVTVHQGVSTPMEIGKAVKACP
jgi:hypothetical protein